MLARYRLPLPLGGTSNHFKTAVLRESDAWDPFNVTEDADLGMRLYRLGYRSGVITRHTLEDAPETLPVWMGQRTRWFKGWLQTWLVMMRNPLALMREMGPRGFLVFQLLIGGMLLSSLAHPLMLVFVAQWIVSLAGAGEGGLDPLSLVLFWIDGANILLSYAVFLVMGTAAMSDYERRQVRGSRIMVPVYWLMVSYGAWKAVLQLRTNPFFWDKTPHRPAKLAPWLHFSPRRHV
jgi:cellulose synthase/poly-beta-1,6-N-acetylglucosamine synthase-like glycosyltransferase